MIIYSKAGKRLLEVPWDTLEKANLTGAELVGADLRGANLTGAELVGADLRGADLRGANLRGANLTEAELVGADLRGADLRGANLRWADISEAELVGANLTGADISGANLSKADLSGTIGIATEEEERAALREAAKFILDAPDRLEMGKWHCGDWSPSQSPEEAKASCGTTHCLAGTLQALCQDEKVRALSPWIAGSRLAPRWGAPLFYAEKSVVLEMLERMKSE